MKINIVGFNHSDFTSKAGKHIVGTVIYFTYPVVNNPNLVGSKTDSALIVDSIIHTNDIKCGEADIFYNKSGFVDSLIIHK